MRCVATVRTLFLGLLLASMAYAESPASVHTIANAVDTHYNKLQSLQSEFSETYRGNGTERVESGTLWMKKPGKMRWEYRSPKEKLFLSDGRDAWFYVPGERQARREPFSKLEDLRSPLGFLLGKTKLEKELRGLSKVTDQVSAESGNVILRGVPQSLENRVSQVVLEINPGNQIARILIEEVDGAITEYRLDQQRENLVISDDRFRFSPPPGVETIEGELGQ